MIFQRVSFLAGLLLTVETSVGVKLDPNVGSNWLIPLKSSSTVAPSAYSNVDITTPGPEVGSVFYNIENSQGSQSSFVPTVTGGGHADTSKFYPIPYQYYQYQHLPDTQSFRVVPFVRDPLASAMQRQEFFAVNPNVVTVDQGDFSISAPAPPPPAPGLFGGLPSIGDIFNGIGGAASNTAQSIGLGGLGLAGGTVGLLIGAPLLIFAVAFPIAIMVFAILGLPVIQLTLPPSDGVVSRKLKNGLMHSARKAREVLESEECLERFSCALAKKSRRLPYENWILRKMEDDSNTWANRVSKSVKMGRVGENCEKFTCTPLTKLVQTVNEKML